MQSMLSSKTEYILQKERKFKASSVEIAGLRDVPPSQI